MAEFLIENNNKTFTIVVSGFAKEKTNNFVEDLKKNVSSINPKDFSLIVDAEEMRTFKPEILPTLEKSYALYMSLGFKHILMLKPKRVTPRLQLKRIAKQCNFTGKFVDGKQNALEMISRL